jgi:hypothetical protein
MTHLDCRNGLVSSFSVLDVSYFYPIKSLRPNPPIYLHKSLSLLLGSLSSSTLQPSPAVLPTLSYPTSSDVDRKANMAHLRRFLATFVQYGVWIVTKCGQYTHVYYCKHPLPPTKKFAPDEPNIPSDHPRDVHAWTLWQPNRLNVDQLISYMKPLQQYQMIRQISDPSQLV